MASETSQKNNIDPDANPPDGLINVAAYLPEMARKQPDKPAIVFSHRRRGRRMSYSHISFRQLDRLTDRYAHGLVKIGISRGMRVILMVRPSEAFFALTFALWKIGAVVVLIDPGMGKQRMVHCLRDVQAEAFIGIPLAHLLRILHPSAFRSIRISLTVGRRWLLGGRRLKDIYHDPWRPYPMPPMRHDDPAAIIFTTGSTGPPKGVLYCHGMFDAQVRILRDQFNIQPDEIDLPTFPLFALFDPALGMTAVIPDMDPTRPGHVDPERIIGAIHDQKVTHMFGSPALLNRVGQYGEARRVKLPTLRRVLSAGAPASHEVLRRFATMLIPPAEIFTPYGATEALPVASIGSREILEETAEVSACGGGTCVGKTVCDVDLKIIKISDLSIETWSDDLVLPSGEIGEIVVTGPVVTREYFSDPAATRLAKIHDGAALWHRMGDVGRLDERGRLWLCGRKAHRVITTHGTLFTLCCEAIFNQHPWVFRTALVGIGRPPEQTPVICVELRNDAKGKTGDRRFLQIRDELLELGRQQTITRQIRDFILHPAFPVDIRHNAKIFREKLAIWAAGQMS